MEVCIIKRKNISINRRWKPTVIKGKKLQEFIQWLNAWGDFSKRSEWTLDDYYTIGKGKNRRPNHITEFGEGYNQAISDVWDKLGIK